MTRNLCCGLRLDLEKVCSLDSFHCFWLAFISPAHDFNNDIIFMHLCLRPRNIDWILLYGWGIFNMSPRLSQHRQELFHAFIERHDALHTSISHVRSFPNP